jgi:hypothetical protein
VSLETSFDFSETSLNPEDLEAFYDEEESEEKARPNTQ